MFAESDKNDISFAFVDLELNGIRSARRELEAASAAVGEYRRVVSEQGYDGNDLERMLQRILETEAERL